MEKRFIAGSMILYVTLLSGCMSREEAAKHVTITLIQSPEALLEEWQVIPTTQVNIKRFESPLGSIEINQTPTDLTAITQSEIITAFSTLKQQTEQRIIHSNSSLINTADDDSLQIAQHDFLHSTYRTRANDNQRQRIELYIAPVNNRLISVIVQIGDDVDMHSYNELQSLLTQQVYQMSQTDNTDKKL